MTINEKAPVSEETPAPVPEEVATVEGAEVAVVDAEGGVEEVETFSREYVEKLRAEAAENRVRAKRADEAMERLRAAAVANAVQGILMRPDDLTWSEDLTDEHGWPDEAKILAAAEAQVARSPHLGRPRGDVGMGVHSERTDDVSLVGILASGA